MSTTGKNKDVVAVVVVVVVEKIIIIIVVVIVVVVTTILSWAADICEFAELPLFRKKKISCGHPWASAGCAGNQGGTDPAREAEAESLPTPCILPPTPSPKSKPEACC